MGRLSRMWGGRLLALLSLTKPPLLTILSRSLAIMHVCSFVTARALTFELSSLSRRARTAFESPTHLHIQQHPLQGAATVGGRGSRVWGFAGGMGSVGVWGLGTLGLRVRGWGLGVGELCGLGLGFGSFGVWGLGFGVYAMNMTSLTIVTVRAVQPSLYPFSPASAKNFWSVSLNPSWIALRTWARQSRSDDRHASQWSTVTRRTRGAKE